MVKFSRKPLTLLGTASVLPGDPIDNVQLIQWLERYCGDSLVPRARAIARRLGIKERYLCRSMESGISEPLHDAPGLCCDSLQGAMQEAGLEVNDIGYLIGHTTTPHTLIPGNTAWVVDRLGFQAPYMELRQACTGFANALMIASGLLESIEGMDTLAISGSEVGSMYFSMDESFVDEEQLLNFMQMGDGAASVILAKHDGGDSRVISDIFLGHIGIDKPPGFFLAGGGSGSVHCPKGLPVFRHNGEAVKKSGAELFLRGIQSIQQRGYVLEDFDYIIPHQANGHIGRMLSEVTGIPESRFVVDADQLGNLGSAAIWVSFDRLRKSGRLESGDRVLILGAEATKYLYGGFVYQH